ncbi:hypothetical protein MHAS_01492 [Mycolicibacterium hassiacum DSM 44199]|nr:hypothetical protein [Mycolicibacterium hassiacum DSM 44199]VCT89793.1 hypothetical protein MHAS_01492 [Mycolicibacterium hassiacum DSM 44199]
MFDSLAPLTVSRSCRSKFFLPILSRLPRYFAVDWGEIMHLALSIAV